MGQTTIERRPVVVGVDDSDSACDAASWAGDLAALWDAALCLTHMTTKVRYGAPIDQETRR